MALSNIKREPRREITEQVIGVVVVAGYFFGVYELTQYLGAGEDKHPVMATLFGMFILSLGIPILLCAAFMFVVLLHEVGDFICDLLGLVNLDPRPKRRWY